MAQSLETGQAAGLRMRGATIGAMDWSGERARRPLPGEPKT
jgi:hypothetical protein